MPASRSVVGALVVVLAVLVYVVVKSGPEIEVKAFVPKEPRKAKGVWRVNRELEDVRMIPVQFQGAPVFGPESVTFDSQGRIYTALYDGTVARLNEKTGDLEGELDAF